jgi:methylmalonyl-CoA mutase cobalamin-binding subunit
MKVLGASLGDCVHVAGITRFLRAAEDLGCQTSFTGPATDLETLVDAIRDFDPDIIGVSYRLTPDNLRPLLDALPGMLAAAGIEGKRLAFGGTPPVVAVAKEYDIFEVFFEGGESWPRAMVRSVIPTGRSSASTGKRLCRCCATITAYRPAASTRR